MKRAVSPRELADAMGVSESSLKRWTDSGRLSASRTVGGHRKILLTEAIRFIRDTRTPLVYPELLGLTDVARVIEDVSTIGTDAERLYSYLAAGRAGEARGLLSALYLSGQSVAQICDGPLREAMARIGELWHHQPRGIFLEHRAFDIALQGLSQLRPLIPAPPAPVTACGGALAGDPYILPSLSVALALQAEGVGVVNVGANTPIESLAQAAEDGHIRLLWISVSCVVDAGAAAEQVGELAESLAGRGVAVVLGGRASAELSFGPAAHVTVLPTLGALVDFVRRRWDAPGAVTTGIPRGS